MSGLATRPHPSRLRAALARVLVTLVVAVAGASSAASYTYDVDLYNTFVSNGSWRTFSTMTNSTSRWITWRLTFSTRSCTDLSGAVSLGIAASIAPKRSYCTTSSREMSTAVAPASSAAAVRRDVTHFDYYLVRKIDRYSGRTVSTGYVTRKDTFSDYAFSSHY